MKVFSYIAYGFSAFTIATLLGQMTIAYASLRLGLIGLIGMMFLACMVIGVWSLIDMFRSRGYIGNNWMVALLPMFGLMAIVGFAVVLGVAVG